MNIQSLIVDDTNLVEVFFVHKSNRKGIRLDVSVNDDALAKVRELYVNPRTSRQKLFHQKAMTYMYDLNDDSQCVYTRTLTGYSNPCHGVHMYSYKHSKMPTHLFPCTNTIEHVSECEVSEYRITNRISLKIMCDEHGSYVFVQYRHSDNVEIDKVQSCIDGIIKNLSKII